MLFRLGMEYSRTKLSMSQEGIVVCPLLENIGNLSGMVHMQMNPLLQTFLRSMLKLSYWLQHNYNPLGKSYIIDCPN